MSCATQANQAVEVMTWFSHEATDTLLLLAYGDIKIMTITTVTSTGDQKAQRTDTQNGGRRSQITRYERKRNQWDESPPEKHAQSLRKEADDNLQLCTHYSTTSDKTSRASSQIIPSETRPGVW